MVTVTVQRWSGRETRLFREAMRMGIRDFADYLGISDRAISNWEAGGESYRPRAASQSVLDTSLALAPEEARARFADALGVSGPGPSAVGEMSVDSHKFLPVFVGAERAHRLRAQMTGETPADWLEPWSATVEHPHALTCTLHVFACGVVVFHIVQPRKPSSLTELAVWRYRSYASDLPWAKAKIHDLLGEHHPHGPNPEYVLSLYWLTAGPWTGSQYDTAMRLLSTPSVLVDRGAPEGPVPLAGAVEESLLTTGFDHPDIVSFGVRGVSTGYAGWSGVSYAALSQERSLTVEELVSRELIVQALWCYTHHIQQRVEEGGDPSTPDRYGWRFLRAANSRLTTARAQETAQHCLMREAIMRTSGLPERLRAAQDALRESMG